MRPLRASLLLAALLAAAPGAARADDTGGFGLDLTDDANKKPPDKPADNPPAPADNPPASDTPTTGPVGGRDPLIEEPGSAPKKDKLDVGEKDVSLEDRVKSVQKKRFFKKNHFELAPHVGLSLNDAFYQKFNLGGAATFHLSDALGVSVRGDYLLVQTTANVPTAKRELHSRLPVSKPKYDGALDFQWTPFYGKASFFNTIIQFDTFLLAGAGVVISQTSSNPTLTDPSLNQGPHPCVDLGLGQRYPLNELMAFQWSAVETLYEDTPGGHGPSTLQKLLTVSVGLSFFIPPMRSE